MRTMIGLPSLARGPLFDTAMELGAPIMVSASALARWTDEGPVPEGWEFTTLERRLRAERNDGRPPSPAQRRRRMRRWAGWNTAALDRVADLGLDLSIDSGGFVAMAHWGGHVWTPESYVEGLCTHPAITRASAMDLCVENELSDGDEATAERISRTIALGRRCWRLAREAGIDRKLMMVIQGRTAEEYLRCFDALSGTIAHGATVGVGSMCRRALRGPDGVLSILEALDRRLPADVRLHLFGVKRDGAEAATAFGERIDSVDSQAYGVRARMIANERRKRDASFSKSNVFVAGVMREWYLGQRRQIDAPRTFPRQAHLALDAPAAPRTVLDAIEAIERRRFRELVEEGEVDHDQIIGGRMLEECVMAHLGDLPDGVAAMDDWRGERQLPPALRGAA